MFFSTAVGIQVPAGGTTGQALVKNSNTSYDFTWQTISGGGGGSASMTEIEVDFGATPVAAKTLTITNAAVTASSKIIVSQSGAAPTGKSADENEMDFILANATPASGQFTLRLHSMFGRVRDKFKFNYMVA